MGVEQAVEKARLVVEWVRDVERRGRLVGHFERLLVGGDLAKGIGETGRVTGEQRAGSIRHVLALARHGELDELGDDGRKNGKYQRDDQQDGVAATAISATSAPEHAAENEIGEQGG